MAIPVIPDVPGGNQQLSDPTTPTQKEKVNADGTVNVRLQDPVTAANQATVSQFHNADHQNPGTTAYGLLTGGVAQLLTSDGFIDRQRETGLDQVANIGIVMGSQMFAQAFATTVPTTGTLTSGAASGTITPASMTGILVGTILTVDAAGTPETVIVTAVTATTATVVPTNGAPTAPAFKATHTPSYTVTGFLFNQERDAAGENSGASGKGTAVATEYEETSGGPPLANGTPSLLRYDREVAALGKGASNSGSGYAITSTTAGDTILTPTTAANFKTLTSGQWIQLSGSGTVEYVRVHDSYIVATAPATIALTSPVVNTGQTTATWDTFSAIGPGTNPVLLTGEGLEGVILNDSTKPGFGRMWQGDASGRAQIVGAVASGATNSGNPVKAGGVFNTTQPTVTNGQTVDAQYTARGAQIVATGIDALTSVIQAVSGTALAADQTNSELRVSTYVKTTTAGDTALALGQANMAGSLPVTIASNQGAIGSAVVQAVAGTALTADQTNSILKTSLYGKNAAAADTALGADSGGAVRVSLQGNQTAVTGSAAVAVNNTNSASLPAVASKTNYVTGFSVTTQGGSGAAAGAVTLTGVITGTMTFEAGAAATNPVQMYVTFPAPIPASAVNTAIAINAPAFGANTGAAACTIYGFVQ